MGKIRSVLVQPEGTRDLKAKYGEIYASGSDVWLYSKSHGVHSVIYGQIKGLLPNARVLDVGCGAGRLALMCATRARHVDAIDFSHAAIRIAELNARACATRNVSFAVSGLDGYTSSHAYDLITMVGVLEHVDDPVRSLAQIARLLRPGGLAVVSCPSFLNFRGHTYMTLHTLLGLPMSLADVRQVGYSDIRRWAGRTGFEPTRSVGAIYRFAWEDGAVQDMIKRVPAAVEDSALAVPFDYQRYDAWLHSQIEVNRWYLADLEKRGILKRIQVEVRLAPRRVTGVDDDLWSKMREYLDEDVESDPFFAQVEPYCYQGGECIYLLRKVRPPR